MRRSKKSLRGRVRKTRSDSEVREAAENDWRRTKTQRAKTEKEERKLISQIERLEAPVSLLPHDYGREPGNLISDLRFLASLYGDPVLEEAASRLGTYGLYGTGWRKIALDHQGMWARPDEALAVLAVEEGLAKKLGPEQAYRYAAKVVGNPAYSEIKSATNAVRRTYAKWKDKTPEQRAPVMFNEEAPNPDATAGVLTALMMPHGFGALGDLAGRMRGGKPAPIKKPADDNDEIPF